MLIQISDVTVSPERCAAEPSTVKGLADSISDVGLLNPITVDQDYTLIAGLHRLEAAKLLGWTGIECTISSLEGLQAKLAEVDENVVRKGLPTIEYNDLMYRRKEIYEMLHPETKNGGDRIHDTTRTTKCRSGGAKPFTQDTAEKLNTSRRTVERAIETAKNLTQEAKEIIQCSNRKISKANALKLSKLDPIQQKEAASQFAAKLINSIDEYHAEPDDAEEQKPKQEILPDAGQTAPPPAAPAKKRFLTFEENEADLKDPNKDCSCTPDIFLSEISAYIRKFQHGIEWYVTPAYSVVFSELTQAQVGYLRELMDSVRAALDKIFNQIEGSTKE